MQARTSIDLGSAIRDQRRKVGLNQQELAKRVGVTRQWIGAIENGKPTAELGLVLRALSAVGLELHIMPTGRRPTPTTPASLLDDVIQRARGGKR